MRISQSLSISHNGLRLFLSLRFFGRLFSAGQRIDFDLTFFSLLFLPFSPLFPPTPLLRYLVIYSSAANRRISQGCYFYSPFHCRVIYLCVLILRRIQHSTSNGPWSFLEPPAQPLHIFTIMRKWAAFPREIRQPSSRVSDTAFDNAFRKSRLNSLPKRERDVPHRQLSRKQKRQAPIDQVYTTTSASFYRQDWGLKRPIPWRNTKFVTLEENDTSTGMTDFNPGDKYTMIQNRIRELQRPVSSILAKNKSQPKQLKRDGLFQPLYIRTFRNSISTTISILYKNYSKWKSSFISIFNH